MKKVKDKIEELWYINGETFVIATILSTLGCVCKWLYHVLAYYLYGVPG